MAKLLILLGFLTLPCFANVNCKKNGYNYTMKYEDIKEIIHADHRVIIVFNQLMYVSEDGIISSLDFRKDTCIGLPARIVDAPWYIWMMVAGLVLMAVGLVRRVLR